MSESQGTTQMDRIQTAPALAAMSLIGVKKRFGDVTAVDGIDFDIAHREFFSLLGPSGCGKTTTLRMLAGFERPSEGRILLEGRDASSVPPNERDTNMVFQSYALFPHMTVAQNIAFGPQRKRLSRKDTEERVGESLATVRLEGYGGRYPRELSGGQQQRVALARALANRPAVLLLDEPLGALDLKLREEMQFELKRIQREVGISFVYVTHDQGEALTMSDRIAVMHDGKVEHLGTPEEVYLRPATLFVAGFIGQASLLPCRVETGGAATVDVVVEDGTRVPATRAGDGCVTGCDAMLVIRPEHMRLSTERPDGDTPAISVTVAEEVFQGSVVRYQLDGPAGVRLTATVPLEERADVHAGSSAWARWLPDWGYVLPVTTPNPAAAEASVEEGPGAAEHA